jgi:sugar/nucleoside kinase (ribokinase family)
MSVLVVGSVALDSIETPTRTAVDCLGGSATHFALASALLGATRLVANIGPDLPGEHIDLLRRRRVDLAGLKVCDGKTFRWSGRYWKDMNTRETVSIRLNVFGEYEPEVPEVYRDSELLFLANGAPLHQLKVLNDMTRPRFTVMDTMDHWIASEREVLEELFRKVDCVVLNDGEAFLLTDRTGVAAAEAILNMGPKYVVMKKGEHGAVIVGEKHTFLIPAYPCLSVQDPTGAGDSFAGGMMGYLDSVGDVTPLSLRTAIAYGTVIASFNVEDFGVKRVAGLSLDEVDGRLHAFREMLAF